MPPHPSALRTAAVTPSDTVDLAEPAERLFIGTGGDVAVQVAGDAHGDTRVFKNVASGSELNVETLRVLDTGTDAADIVAILHDTP